MAWEFGIHVWLCDQAIAYPFRKLKPCRLCRIHIGCPLARFSAISIRSPFLRSGGNGGLPDCVLHYFHTDKYTDKNLEK